MPLHAIGKAGMPRDAAVALIAEGRGGHFDPEIVDAFARAGAEFRAFAARFEDAAAVTP